MKKILQEQQHEQQMSLKELGTAPSGTPSGYLHLYAGDDGKMHTKNALGEVVGLGNDEDTFGISIKNGSTVIPVGFKGFARAKKRGRAVAYRIDSFDVDGNPVVGSMDINITIAGSPFGQATLPSVDSVYDTALTGWTLDFNKDDQIGFSVGSNSAVTNFILTIYFINI